MFRTQLFQQHVESYTTMTKVVPIWIGDFLRLNLHILWVNMMVLMPNCHIFRLSKNLLQPERKRTQLQFENSLLKEKPGKRQATKTHGLTGQGPKDLQEGGVWNLDGRGQWEPERWTVAGFRTRLVSFRTQQRQAWKPGGGWRQGRGEKKLQGRRTERAGREDKSRGKNKNWIKMKLTKQIHRTKQKAHTGWVQQEQHSTLRDKTMIWHHTKDAREIGENTCADV